MSSQAIGFYDKTICNNIEEIICNQSFRETARSISENTGFDITHATSHREVQ